MPPPWRRWRSDIVMVVAVQPWPSPVSRRSGFAGAIDYIVGGWACLITLRELRKM